MLLCSEKYCSKFFWQAKYDLSQNDLFSCLAYMKKFPTIFPKQSIIVDRKRWGKFLKVCSNIYRGCISFTIVTQITSFSTFTVKTFLISIIPIVLCMWWIIKHIFCNLFWKLNKIISLLFIYPKYLLHACLCTRNIRQFIHVNYYVRLHVLVKTTLHFLFKHIQINFLFL